ncbi:multidrug effflux MFS transporter [Myceligenerans xiligouense]|uniref:DHA1 family bicyclomycin/chloramphenicol resistance-like MFS transporter n=1 Tax=Myceligenerans xiligouense TaxID=253184 RepID=A0A3N4YV28_9MICO|nr:multidrug effflux MFS transporter [Myceligenerans xiligouense]RPF22450.1 DHA1 family bicyclomycin/chloramphenicol resistance-like MFS transporter [Myceligenerans xiligouense]
MSTAQLASRPVVVPTAPIAPSRPRGKTVALWVVMLGSLCALPAFTTDMYLPGIPQVAADLGSTEAMAQLTVSAMLIGGGLGQLVIGPLSDRFGRRAPLLVGLAMHVVTSLLCAVVPSMSWLIALRVLQGFFNAAAGTTAMAVVRDRFVGAEAARVLSRLMLVIGIAPMFAPTIGAAILTEASWRWVFVLLAAMGVVLALIVLRFMPETHGSEQRAAARPGRMFAGYATLLRDRQFLALAVLPGLSFGVLMSYVVSSPVVFQQEFGLSHGQFSALFAANGVGLVLAAQVNAALVRRVDPMRLMRFAVVAQTVTSAALLGVVLLGVGGLAGLLVVMWLALAATPLIQPNAAALAMSRHGEIAGTSAAMIGAAQSSVAGIVSSLAGFLGGGSVAMVSVMFASVVGALLVMALATPAFRRRR